MLVTDDSRFLYRHLNKLVPQDNGIRYRHKDGTARYVDHREPFVMFGKQYCWTLFDQDWNMTNTLRLVPYEAYRDIIQRNLRLATLQGLA